MPHPPRLIEWLLEQSLPPDLSARDAVLGDLQEEYAERHAQSGRVRAQAWYLRQAAKSVLPNLRRRFTRASRTADLASDLRVAARSLARRPAFLATAVGTVALAIGSATAVFSVADATVLRALNLPERDRVVALWSTFDATPDLEFPLSAAELTDVRDDVRAFEMVGGWQSSQALLGPFDGAPARTVDAAFTIGEIYAIAGARTSAGRLPGADDDRLGAPRVAVIGHGLWREAFGGDPGIFGTRAVRVGATEAVIIGALAPGVTLPGYDAGIWVHTVLDPASWQTDRSGHGIQAVARLAPGAGERAARAEIDALHDRWAERYAGRHSFGREGHRLGVDTLSGAMLGSAQRTALLLSIAAGLLLVLACANVANLLLGRGETRTTETGVRIALGASTRRVVQPVLLEGLVLGLAGGAAGLALAAAGVPALLRLAPDGAATLEAVRMDVRVLAFAITLSIVTGLLFAAAPAWRAARRAPSDLLRASGRGRTGALGGLRALVAGQAALATVLLSGAALLALSLFRIGAIDPGLDLSASRIATRITLPTERYPDAATRIALHDAIRQRLQATPGTERVAAVRTLPLRDQLRYENVLREGDHRPEDRLVVGLQVATPGSLRALGVRLIEGRGLEPGDRDGSVRVALLNQSAARGLWPDGSAVGRRIRGTFLPRDAGLLTVVGVYADVRNAGLSSAPAPELMLPIAQASVLGGWLRQLTLIVQTSAPPASAIGAIRSAVADVDPGIAVGASAEMDDVVNASFSRERFLAVLVTIFSLMALAIAAVGVYGVVAFTVARQQRELAIRYALGAGRSTILFGVIRRYAAIAAAGAAAGAMLVAVLAPGLEGFLYGVDPRNAAVLFGAPLLLVIVATVASLGPAVGATRVPLAGALQQAD